MKVEAWGQDVEVGKRELYLGDGGSGSVCLRGAEGRTGNAESTNCIPAVDTTVKCSGLEHVQVLIFKSFYKTLNN